MKTDRVALWQALQSQGMVDGEMPTTILEAPWYVRLLTGFAGWLAALFMLGFLGAAFELVFDNPAVATVLGLVMIGLAWWLMAGQQMNDFKNQFVLAMSLAGQGLVVYAIFDVFHDLDAVCWLLVAVLQIVLSWVMPNSLHRLWSAFAAGMALCIALAYGHVFFIQTALLMAVVALAWLRELEWLQWHDRLKPIAYGLTLALLYQASSGQFYRAMLDIMLSVHDKNALLDRPWLGDALSGLVMLAMVWFLLKQHSKTVTEKYRLVVMSGAGVLILASLEIHGLTIGVMVMLLGFANGNRILTGLGIISLLFYISSYYYLLDTTLLYKAGHLAMVGLLLLGARLLMHHYLGKGREVEHA